MMALIELGDSGLWLGCFNTRRLRLSHLRHGWHEVATGGLELVDDGVSRHGPHAGNALHVLVGEVGLALLFALGESHVERFGADDASVHLRHRLGGLFGGGEADKAEALGATLLQHHLRWRPTINHNVVLSYPTVVISILRHHTIIALQHLSVTLALVIDPNGENSLRSFSSSMVSSRFLM